VTGWARKGTGQVPKTLVITDPDGLICGVARSSARPNKLINRVFYQGTFPDGGFVAYIKNYDARVRYVVRSADKRELSEETIEVVPALKDGALQRDGAGKYP
jgi:hypothetical protein